MSVFFVILGTILLDACIPSSSATLPALTKGTNTPTTTTTLHSTITPRHLPTTISVPSATVTQTPDIWSTPKCEIVHSIIEDFYTFMIWEYIGDIAGRGEFTMLLNFPNNNEILGFAFEYEHIQEYQVMGCVQERDFMMWLSKDGSVDVIIQGEFPKTDPRGYYTSSGTLLSFDVITGWLSEKGNSEQLPVYLHLASGQEGTMDHRFQIANVEDDELILIASQQFLAAVARDDRSRVIEMLHFPIKTWYRDEEITFHSSETFLSQYDNIFDDSFKERLSLSFSNYLIAYTGNYNGISLSVYGGGGINFNEYGQVNAIYNWEKPTPTPIPTTNGN